MEEKICKKCNKSFELTAEDFDFLKKMKVPAPTWCVECRLQRRLSFRNEQNLYKRKCDAPGHSEEIISNYSSEKKTPVYDHEYWWSDEWDAMNYGKEYDFNKSFFEQFKELLYSVPTQNLLNFNSINSDYCNFITDNKNCYLVFGGDFNEDCSYSGFNFRCKSSQDLYWVFNSENCYECINSKGGYKVRYSHHFGDCSDSYFLFNCKNLNNCIGCVDMKNKSYCILNKQYTKEEYEKKKEELKLDTHEGVEKFRVVFEKHKMGYPNRFANIIKAQDCSGDNIIEANNCINCFDITGPAEDLKDVYLSGFGLKDSRGVNSVGHNSELTWDTFAVFNNCRNVSFSFMTSTSYDIQYCMNNRGSNNLFGCVGLKNKSYCIFNKQYTKEEYEELIPKIIEHMDSTPYKDKVGREYGYGEYFPSEISPFAYNETISYELFPLVKEEVLKNGWGWKDVELSHHKPTITEIPNSINEVNNDILKEVLPCEHAGKCNDGCTFAFKITSFELEFYKNLNIPLPRLCFKCRHYARLAQRNPLTLWDRNCQCAGKESENGKYNNTINHFHKEDHCPNSFKTTFAPERKDIIYCGDCYKSETS